MIRSIFATLSVFVAVSAVSAQGCKASGVGDPCIPEQEYDTQFSGFDPQEVNVESKSFQCLTRVCLVNHFRGRVTCPYGQDSSGNQLPSVDGATGGAFPGTDPNGVYADQCVIPGGDKSNASDVIVGPSNGGGPTGKQVEPQCVDREATNTVYCSCRCANADGKTDDGANYCTCPDGFSCAQLVNPVGVTDVGLTGAYCIKKGTDYQSFGSCESPCDPSQPTQNCAGPAIR
jgi:hypothetical protein